MKSFSSQAINYFTNLKTPDNIIAGINIINPYESNDVRKVIADFYNKFYNDNKKRIFI
jgi:hypothetical protein